MHAGTYPEVELFIPLRMQRLAGRREEGVDYNVPTSNSMTIDSEWTRHPPSL